MMLDCSDAEGFDSYGFLPWTHEATVEGQFQKGNMLLVLECLHVQGGIWVM